MKHLALVAALFFGLSSLVGAQEPDVEQEFPRTADCAYNLACGYSLKGEVEPGVEWFGRGVDWGLGYSPGILELAREDGDLDNLRSD